MYDWIIEADVYRLNKAAREASTPRERRELESLAERKAQLLTTKQRAGSGPPGC